MIILDESIKSEAQLKLAEKLERDRKKLQDQIKKDHRLILEKKRKSKNLIGDLFEEHLPDFYNFEAEELKDIIDTAMTQKATEKKIAAIKKAAGVMEVPEASVEGNDDHMSGGTPDTETLTDTETGISEDMDNNNNIPDAGNISLDDSNPDNKSDNNSEDSEAESENDDFSDVHYDNENSEE